MPARKVGRYFGAHGRAGNVRMRASHYREKELANFARSPKTLAGRPRLVRLVFVEAVRSDGKGTMRDWLTREFFRHNFTKRETGTRKRTAYSVAHYRWTSVTVRDHGWRVGAYKGQFHDTELIGKLWKHLEYARVELEIMQLAHANHLMTQGGQDGSAP